jgi:hypothetical protein
MPITESIQYIAVFGITILFSCFALVLDEHKLLTKMIAGLCWFIMSLVQFILGGHQGVLTVPFSLLFMGFGLVFVFSTVTDYWKTEGEKKRNVGFPSF